LADLLFNKILDYILFIESLLDEELYSSISSTPVAFLFCFFYISFSNFFFLFVFSYVYLPLALLGDYFSSIIELLYS
jgi:hypothetical protein